MEKHDRIRKADPKRRYALEWYVDEMFTWLREYAERITNDEAAARKQQNRKIAVLAATSAAISVAATAILFVFLHCKRK